MPGGPGYWRVAFIALLVVGVPSAIVWSRVSDRTADTLKSQRIAADQRIIKSQITACERRGNPQAGYLLWRSRTVTARGQAQAQHIASRVFTIADCERTYRENGGRPVPLAPRERERYLRQIAHGVVPTVRGGKVTYPTCCLHRRSNP